MDKNLFPGEGNHIKSKKHILTTYGWYITVFILNIIWVLNFSRHNTSKIKSVTRDFNETLDPTYFIHLTDVHTTKDLERSGQNLLKAIAFIKASKAETVTITGDLSDNWERHLLWNEAKQNKEDHKYYRELVSQTASNIEDFIDLSGNHDMFDLHSFSSKNNEFLKTSQFYKKQGQISYENFTVSTYESKEGITFVIINSVIYPAPRALYDLFYPPPIEFLNRIEDELQSVKGKKPVVLMTHFPAYHWYNKRSKYGHTFRDMLQIYSFNVALSGHTHPYTPVYIHHNKNIEIIGSDCFNHHGIGVVSFDNGNTVYHEFKVEEIPKAIITNPVPKNILSKHDSFNSNDVEIRALVFTNDSRSIIVTENNETLGEMTYERTVREGVQLYHLKHHFENGTHLIKFKGFYQNSLEFFVGDTLPSFKESNGFQYNLLSAPKPLFITLMVFFFIITFPISVEGFSTRMCALVKRRIIWMYEDSSTWFELFSAYIFGFMFVRWRILKLPILVRILLFVGLFSPFIFPVVIQSIDGHWGVVTTYGVYNSGVLIPSIGNDVYRLAHIWFIEAPAVFLCTLFYDYQKFRNIYLIEYLNIGFGFFFCIFILAKRVSQATKIWFTLTSPIFILWPAFMYICIIFWRTFHNMKHADEMDLITSSAAKFQTLATEDSFSSNI